MFRREPTDENQADLLRVLEAGLTSLQTQTPTNLHRDGLAADDLRITWMTDKRAEFSWLGDANTKNTEFYLNWVKRNREKIDAVLSKL